MTRALRVLPQWPRPAGVDSIADAIEDRLDDIIDLTLEGIEREIPIYTARGPHVTAETRSAARLVDRSFLEMLRTSQPPNESVARFLGNVGADRALQGIPLGDLLQAFRISARSMADVLRRVVEEGDLSRDAALWVAEAIVLWVDVISNLAAADYTRAQARLVSESEERRRAFLLNVLYGGIAGEAALARAEEVGWDQASQYLVAAAGRPDGSETPDEARKALMLGIDRCFVAAALEDVVVLAPTPSDAKNVEVAARKIAARHGLLIGLSTPRSGVEGVRRSYLDASEALAIARANDAPVVYFEEAVLDRILLRDPDLLKELFDRTIGPLVEYDARRGTELVVTLETYAAEDESPTRAAQRLHTHPQTVRYRLSRINDLTALAVDSTTGRLQLLLGLRARRLLRAQRRIPPPQNADL